MVEAYQAVRELPVTDLRRVIRRGDYSSHTAGLAKGHEQANVVILPEPFALDFMRFCHRNPKPCPLIGVSDTGDSLMPTLGSDIDIATDVPLYNLYENGSLSESPVSIKALWQTDFVAFALGCSFTFEHALLDHGFDLWHITNNVTVPMFQTSIQTIPAGCFHGNMVVSLRMIPDNRVPEAVALSRNYPLAHGAPVHIGNPADIGIADIARPEWGDAVPLLTGHTPVFWACGVTPQAAIQNAQLPICITHKPGHMLITDLGEVAETSTVTNT